MSTLVYKPRKWSSEEDRYLKENAPHKNVEELARDLGRSVRSVRGRAYSLKIKIKKKKPKPRRMYDPSVGMHNQPFEATDNFIKDYRFVHKEHPKCGICEYKMTTGDTVRWVAIKMKKILVCGRCEA